jgi:hypothetical protein
MTSESSAGSVSDPPKAVRNQVVAVTQDVLVKLVARMRTFSYDASGTRHRALSCYVIVRCSGCGRMVFRGLSPGLRPHSPLGAVLALIENADR